MWKLSGCNKESLIEHHSDDVFRKSHASCMLKSFFCRFPKRVDASAEYTIVLRCAQTQGPVGQGGALIAEVVVNPTII